MNIELLDNLFQILLFLAAAVNSVFFAVRYRKREYLILGFSYGSYLLGTAYYTLCIALTGSCPQVFYVAECSWIASYFFLLTLAISLRIRHLSAQETEAAGGLHPGKRPVENRLFLPKAAAPAALVSAFTFLIGCSGPAILTRLLSSVALGAAVWVCVSELIGNTPDPVLNLVIIVQVLLQIMIYLVSAFTEDYSVFNLYYAVDLLYTLTAFSVSVLLFRREGGRR